jgi:Xaa-Pro aminopeptidase
MTETAEKLERVRSYLSSHKLDAVIFYSRANFAWLSGGGDNHVVSQADQGFGALVVTPKQALVVANKIELDRLVNEEGLSAFTRKSFPWIDSMDGALSKLGLGGNVAADMGISGTKPLPGDFIHDVRAQLTESEIRRYKALGRDCSMVVETVARQLEVGQSEQHVEGELARHLLTRGVQPHVLLVAFDQRIQRYRHAIPKNTHLKKHAMLVVCGQRGGLIACLTRFVHFGAVPPDIQARHEAVCRVEAALWHATKPAAKYSDVFAAGIEQYKKEGFQDEWELHHQGGPTGYFGRDFLATPNEHRAVRDHQAVAWNPSITGAKSEDTFIVDGGNRHVVTACAEQWPTVKATLPGLGTLTRPGILVK